MQVGHIEITGSASKPFYFILSDSQKDEQEKNAFISQLSRWHFCKQFVEHYRITSKNFSYTTQDSFKIRLHVASVKSRFPSLLLNLPNTIYSKQISFSFCFFVFCFCLLQNWFEFGIGLG